MTTIDPPPDDLQPTNQTTLDGVKRAILSIDPETTTPEQMAAAMVFMDGINARLKELSGMFENAAIEWLRQNGDLEIGPLRYYVGTTTVKKCKDVRAATETIITAAGGDLDLFAGCLASSPFKIGATEALLGADGFEALFDKIVLTDLKTGKPRRGIKKLDSRFLTNKKAPEQENDYAQE